MTGHWFRFYDGVVDDPKVQRLSPALFRLWVNLLCLSSGNNGQFPALAHLCFSLRLSEKSLSAMIDSLVSAGLVDATENGFEPHNWGSRQFKTDVSTERVRAFRERHKKRDETVSGNAPDTEHIQKQSQNRTEKRAPPAAFVLPDFIPSGPWEDFLEMRKKGRSSPTPRAQELLARALEKLMVEGHDPAEVLNQSIQNSWKGVFPINGGHNGSKPNGTGRKQTALDQHMAGAALLIADIRSGRRT